MKCQSLQQALTRGRLGRVFQLPGPHRWVLLRRGWRLHPQDVEQRDYFREACRRARRQGAWRRRRTRLQLWVVERPRADSPPLSEQVITRRPPPATGPPPPTWWQGGSSPSNPMHEAMRMWLVGQRASPTRYPETTFNPQRAVGERRRRPEEIRRRPTHRHRKPGSPPGRSGHSARGSDNRDLNLDSRKRSSIDLRDSPR